MTEDARASLNKFHRVMWYVLVVLAEVIGFFSGLAFGMIDFWLAPATGLFAMGGVIVLAESLYRLSKEPVERRRHDQGEQYG